MIISYMTGMTAVGEKKAYTAGHIPKQLLKTHPVVLTSIKDRKT